MLNFLKTLLPAANTEEQPTPPQQEETPPPPPVQEEEKENAYLHFLEAHERRARRK